MIANNCVWQGNGRNSDHASRITMQLSRNFSTASTVTAVPFGTRLQRQLDVTRVALLQSVASLEGLAALRNTTTYRATARATTGTESRIDVQADMADGIYRS